MAVHTTSADPLFIWRSSQLTNLLAACTANGSMLTVESGSSGSSELASCARMGSAWSKYQVLNASRGFIRSKGRVCGRFWSSRPDPMFHRTY